MSDQLLASMQVLSKEYPTMETANEIMREVVPILMVPINRYLRYLILCPIYMRDMVIKMTELNAVKDGVEEKMRQNISNNLEVPVQVGGWLGDVGKINAKVEMFLVTLAIVLI